MKNALILKLMDYASATEDFMYLLDILTSTDEESTEFRQLIDDKIEEVGISAGDDQEDLERQVVAETMISLENSGAIITHKASNKQIIKLTTANTIPTSLFKAWIEETRYFYISSLTELTLQLGGKIYRFNK